MKQKNQNIQIIGGVIIAVFVIAIIFTVTQLSGTVTEIMDTAVSRTPDAILASAGIEEGMNVSLPVLYYDQKSDKCVDMYDTSLSNELKKRQFEWTSCDYIRKEVEEGLVESELDEKYSLVGKGGKLTPNKGLDDISRWFTEVEGKSNSYSGVLKMNYDAEKSEFEFFDGEFYPLDEVEFGEGDSVNSDGHNHLFTMSFAVPFTALLSGEEEVEISADDDTFVFVGKELVADMGGIHDATTKILKIEKNGDIYVKSSDEEEPVFSGVNIGENRNSIIRIFHADRDSKDSTFKVRFSKMDLNVTNVKIAESGEDGVQIAYDPSDLTYTAPLGESLVLQPDNTKSKIVMATIEGGIVLVLSVLLTSAIHFIFRAREQKQ
ncbi:hypothetical protein IJH24_01320 [Candidatus Saccharibacteria bacterium]|nr:hypothetical protein [Candidatus Saccharibacteria bacterium]